MSAAGQTETDGQAADGEATEVCGATSDPSLGIVETCVLEPGHQDPKGKPTPHQSEAGSIWPNKP